MNSTHPHRRFFRYSLRTLFVVVTVFCVFLGIPVRRALDQKHVAEAFRNLGGSLKISYEYQITQSAPPGPEWLRRLIGDDYFFTIVALELRGSNINDANLAAIKRLTDIRWLDIDATKITDDGLEHLTGLTDLQRLNLVNTKITDTGMEHLEGLTTLRWLNLYGTEVTAGGVEKLQQKLPDCVILFP